MKRQIKLCLHTGGEEVNFSDVLAAKTPDRTESYVPVPHGQFVTLVKSGLQTAGLEIVGESHALAKGGDRYFGLIQVAKPQIDNPDYSLILGVRNSHDKKFPAGIVAGSGVFVCDNLAFSGEVKEFRKHTVNLLNDLPFKVTKAIASLNDLWVSQDIRLNAYKESALTSTMALHHLLLQAFEVGAVPITYIPHILNEFKNPSHEEFRNSNIWSLFNAATEVLKRSNLHELPNRTLALHAVLDGFCGIALEKKE